MYALLTGERRLALSEDAFVEAYTAFEQEVSVTGREVSFVSAVDGSATLQVRLSTAYFGVLEYAIELSLVRESDVYLVSWSPANIHPELKDGRSLKGTVERPRRGSIVDRHGEPLAITKDVRLVGLNRALITDPAPAVAALGGLGFSKEQIDAAFASRLAANQRVPVGPVPDDKAEAALAAMRSVTGVIVYFETQRVHPLGPAAAHVVGYTRELTADELAARAGRGFLVGDRVGAVGLEAVFEAELAGSIGAELGLVEPDGTLVRRLFSREFVPGRDIATTLDATVLLSAHRRLGGRAGAVVVLDPRSNELLAVVSSPSFDPDAFERNDAVALRAITSAGNGPLANRATTGLYSGGSTFKLVTGAAGLLHGGFSVRDEIFCGSTWNGLDPPRRNWEGSQGPLTVAEALMRSCNPVFYQIGLALYQTTDGALSRTARSFGFGSSLGVVGLPDEPGLVPDESWKKAARNDLWYAGDEVNLAIGQGDLLVTPLQLANAYSAFLNNLRRTPVLLAGQEPGEGQPLGLSAEQWAHLRLGLELVTGKSGTAAEAFWALGYNDFGGKSGTAEDAGQQQHVLFVAYSPRRAPEALAAVVLDEGLSGSVEAGPIARDVVLAALSASR
jgi:penicillin-binding protein 2